MDEVFGQSGSQAYSTQVSFASRALQMMVTETLSAAQAQNMLAIDVTWHAGGRKPVAPPGIGDETVMTSPRTVIMRKGKLVLDISVADFGDSDAIASPSPRRSPPRPPSGSNSRRPVPCHDALLPMC